MTEWLFEFERTFNAPVRTIRVPIHLVNNSKRADGFTFGDNNADDKDNEYVVLADRQQCDFMSQ